MKKLLKFVVTAAILATVFGGFISCSKKDVTVVKLGITGAAEEDIWQPAIASLKKEGIEIQLVQFSDYVAPSRALEDGSLIRYTRSTPKSRTKTVRLPESAIPARRMISQGRRPKRIGAPNRSRTTAKRR